MRKAILEGIMMGSIALMIMFALFVWGVVIAEVGKGHPAIQMSLVVLLTIAIPVTLNVLQYKNQKENLADQTLSNEG